MATQLKEIRLLSHIERLILKELVSRALMAKRLDPTRTDFNMTSPPCFPVHPRKPSKGQDPILFLEDASDNR